MGRLGRRGADAGRRLGTMRADDARDDDARVDGAARDVEGEYDERRGRDVDARAPAARAARAAGAAGAVLVVVEGELVVQVQVVALPATHWGVMGVIGVA